MKIDILIERLKAIQKSGAVDEYGDPLDFGVVVGDPNFSRCSHIRKVHLTCALENDDACYLADINTDKEIK